MNRSNRKDTLRGQMALKSSPLNPSRGKLVSQHLVVDHMSAHYNKLLNAKSAIDASVPKAYLKSQQVRDREARNQVLSGKPQRPSAARTTNRRNSRTPAVNGGGRYSARLEKTQDWALDDDDYDGFTREERDRINSLVNETINTDRIDQFLKEDNSIKPGKMSPRSAGSGSGGMRTSRGAAEAHNMDTSRRRKMSADILDKRNHTFSEGNQFTPRTLRNPKYQNVPSKLSLTKHFRPAKATAPAADSKGPVKAYAPSHTESDLLDETLMSRDFTSRVTMSGTVPKLDISIDHDHMKWLQEQSARHESSHYSPLEAELRKEAVHTSNMSKSFTRKKIQKEDEELLYLDFITAVTNDVLTRGIFTNRVLHKVFEEHIQKNKDKLSETRMRSMLDNLRSDLGISPPDEPYQPTNPEDVGMGAQRPDVRSKSRTTGYTGNISQFKNVRLGQERVTEDIPPPEQNGFSKDNEMDLAASLEPPHTADADPTVTLTDIAEVSEKSSLGSKRSRKSTSRTRPQVKEQTDELAGLLGLDDVEPVADKPLMTDVQSVQSGLSTHTSDQRSHRSDQRSHTSDQRSHTSDQRSHLSDQRSHTSAQRSHMSDQRSHTSDQRSHTSDRTLTQQYADQVSDREKADGLSDQASHHSIQSKQRSQPGSEGQRSQSGSTTKATREVTEEQRSRPSSGSQRSRKGSKPESREVTDSDNTPEHKRAEEENQEELESNADFGKTTLFAKTRDMHMTYKALSQASEGEDEDGKYDYDDDF